MSQNQETLLMTLTKSTKGTHVYGDSNPESPVPTLYIKKAALPVKPPAEIEVTIAFEGRTRAVKKLKIAIVLTVVVPLAGCMVASLVYLLSLIFGGA